MFNIINTDQEGWKTYKQRYHHGDSPNLTYTITRTYQIYLIICGTISPTDSVSISLLKKTFNYIVHVVT